MSASSDFNILAGLEKAAVEEILRCESHSALAEQWTQACVRKREFYPHALFTFFHIPAIEVVPRAEPRLTLGGYTFARLAGFDRVAAFTLHTDSRGKLSHLTSFMDDDGPWPSQVTGYEVYSMKGVSKIETAGAEPPPA